MFVLKKKYYLIIENIKDINLKNIKKFNKFVIIYRNDRNNEEKISLLKFRERCRLKSIDFFVANNLRLATYLKADGVYLSASNKSFKALNIKKKNFSIIGSAHNLREISLKNKQRCVSILFSKLFLVNYDKSASFLGIIKFNNLILRHKNLIPLGGINNKNLKHLNNVKSQGFTLMTEIKKKPANIINRLF